MSAQSEAIEEAHWAAIRAHASTNCTGIQLLDDAPDAYGYWLESIIDVAAVDGCRLEAEILDDGTLRLKVRSID